MSITLSIEDELIQEAKRMGDHKTKEDTVNAALHEYVKLQQRRAMLAEEGKVEFWPGFDHKKFREADVHP